MPTYQWPIYQARDSGVLYIPLPHLARHSAGRCDCAHCKGSEGFYDTLAVAPEQSWTWTVHMPELAGANPQRVPGWLARVPSDALAEQRKAGAA